MQWLKKLFGRTQSLDELMHSQIEKVIRRGPFPQCGGCGELVAHLDLVCDKKGNHGYLCRSCAMKYKTLLDPGSVRNFWMCGVCGYRVLAGTEIDGKVDQPGSPCPQCGTDVNISLVNLNRDRPTGRGIIGEPLD